MRSVRYRKRMKTFILLSCLFILSLGGNLFAQQRPQVITIGVLPGGKPEAIKKQSILLGQYLQKSLNVPVKIYLSKDYKGLVEALKSEKVDYAFLSALTYIESEKSVLLKVLLKKTWSEPYYYSALVTLKSAKTKNLADFKNKKIAFVDEGSTSGFLYPYVRLNQNGLVPKTIPASDITGSHAESIKWLETGKSDLVAVFADDSKGKTGAWTRFGQKKSNEYQVVWVSEAIPNDPLVVRTSFYNQYPDFNHEFMSALIDIQEEHKEKHDISEVLGFGSLVPATAKQYDTVRETYKSYLSINK